MSAAAHRIRIVEVLQIHGLTTHRVDCACGWHSARMGSKAQAEESWQWHSQHGEVPEVLCTRWGQGRDRCVERLGHIGACRDAFGENTLSLAARFLA